VNMFEKKINWLIWVIFIILLPSSTFASNVEFQEALDEFKQFGANSDPNVIKILRRNNNLVNIQHHNGKISNEIYQNIQKDFATFNKGVADEAAKYAGCRNNSQLSSKGFSPRTDSDYILSSLDPEEPMSPEKIKKALKRYNELMNQHLGTQNVNYAKKLDTDLMANPKAASAEAKKRIFEKRLKEYRESGSIGDPPEPGLTSEEISAYRDEMNEFIHKKKIKIKKLKELRQSGDLTSEEMAELNYPVNQS